MSTALSPHHAAIMRFVQRRLARDGHAPRLEDVRAEFNLSSPSRAHAAISHLVDQGYLARDRRRTRGLSVLRPIPDDRFEDTAKAVCEALGCLTEANIAIVRQTIVQTLIEREAA